MLSWVGFNSSWTYCCGAIKATLVANHLYYKTGKWGTVTSANKNLLFLKSGKIGSCILGVLNGNLGYVGS